MSSVSDDRIPVLLPGHHPGETGTSAWLLDGTAAPPADGVWAAFGGAAHAAGCACCGARSPAAQAFSRLHLARMRGGAFDRVTVAADAAGIAAVLAALRDDPVAAARFRLAGQPGRSASPAPRARCM